MTNATPNRQRAGTPNGVGGQFAATAKREAAWTPPDATTRDTYEDLIQTQNDLGKKGDFEALYGVTVDAARFMAREVRPAAATIELIDVLAGEPGYEDQPFVRMKRVLDAEGAVLWARADDEWDDLDDVITVLDRHEPTMQSIRETGIARITL